MGGCGSGPWCQYSNKRPTIEQFQRLDIRQIRKASPLLSEGSFFLVTYFDEVPRDAQENATETIFYTWTPCHCGGQRPWLLCPGCGRRVGVLILASSRYRCRHCCGLHYGSQYESEPHRMLRKARKIRRRLGASVSLIDPIQRPKWMHWLTFWRLLSQEEDASMRFLRPNVRRLGIADH